MDTIKLTDKKQVRMIAHRGVSSLEIENTNAAFIAAGNRSYYGIESDVYVTRDKKFIMHHDQTTLNLSGEEHVITETDFDTLRSLKLVHPWWGIERIDQRLASLDEYLSTCVRYEKKAILELKAWYTEEDAGMLCEEIKRCGALDNVVFISFVMENLLYVRKYLPEQPAQFLTVEFSDELLDTLVENKMDLDILFTAVTKEWVDKCHERGIEVNVWTVDDPEVANRMIECGVDYITSNRLE